MSIFAQGLEKNQMRATAGIFTSSKCLVKDVMMNVAMKSRDHIGIMSSVQKDVSKTVIGLVTMLRWYGNDQCLAGGKVCHKRLGASIKSKFQRVGLLVVILTIAR